MLKLTTKVKPIYEGIKDLTRDEMGALHLIGGGEMNKYPSTKSWYKEDIEALKVKGLIEGE